MAETIKGLNIKLGLDASELNEQLKSLKTELKEQQNDLKSINAKLKYDSTNIDLWKQKQEKLNECIRLTKERLEAQNRKLDEARKSLELGAITEEEFNKVRRSVEYAEADISRFNDELVKTKGKIEALSNVKWDSLSKLGSSLTKYVTAPIAATVSALGTLSVKALNTADEIGDVASKVYVGVEAYQEWMYTAEILAVDMNSLQKAFVKVNAILGDIASGDIDKVNEKLALVGLTAEDLKGLSTEDAFAKIRDELSKLGSEAERTAVANEIFGDKLGTELTQLLSASSEKVEELTNRSRELGIASAEDAQKAGDFTDKISDLKFAFRNLSLEISKAFLPLLNKIVDSISNSLIPAVKKVVSWWDSLSGGVKKAIVAFSAFAAFIGPLLSAIGKAVPLLGKIKAAFTAVKGSVMVVGSAVKLSTLGWVGLAAVIAAILLQNEKFKSLLKEIAGIIGNVVSKLAEFVRQVIDALMPILESLMDLINSIIDILVDLIGRLLEPLEEIINVILSLIESIMPIIQKVVVIVAELVEKLVDLLVAILEPIGEALTLIIELVADVINAALGLINSVLDPIMDILGVLVDVIGVVIKLISKVVGVITAVLKPVLKLIVELLKPIFSLISLIVNVVGSVIEALTPLLDIILKPLSVILETLCDLLELFEPMLDAIGNVIETVIAPVLEMLSFLLKPIVELLDAIMDALKWLADGIGEIFGGFGDSVSEFSSNFTNSLGGAFQWVGEKFSGLVDGISNGIHGFVGWLGDLAGNVTGFFKRSIDSAGNWFSSLFDGVGDWFGNAWNGVTGWFSDFGKSVGNWFSDAWNGVSGWFSDTFNLGGGNRSTTTNNNTTMTTNNVTINTSSPEFDIDSVNRALGGSYL